MHISSLTLRNFRNFRKARLEFKNGINTVIGENGSGKTNLFYALRLLIDDSLPRFVISSFSPTDFSRSLSDWKGHWIFVGVEFANLDEGDDAQAIALHTCGDMDVPDRGSYSLCFRPKYPVRRALFDYSQLPEKNQEGLRAILDPLTIDDYEAKTFCRGSGNFHDDSIYLENVGNFDEIIFPDPQEKNEAVIGTSAQRSVNIHSEVSCTFIKALRDVETDLRSYSRNPLLNLLRGKEKTVTVEKGAELREQIQTLNENINSLDELIDLKKGIAKSINEAVGKTYAPGIDIRSDVPDDIDRLFQSLKLWVADADDEAYQGRIRELSLGGANLIYLSLKLLEYERVTTDRIANFLLIEEPEAHVHTHIQKTLFSSLQESKTQVIVSTHSTHISSASHIKSVNILSRAQNESVIFAPANNLEDPVVSRIERYLDAVRSTLLFAKGVILVEGDAEQILIPRMFKMVFGLSLDEIGVSLINVGSTTFANLLPLFHEDRIRRNCAFLTDSDTCILPLPVNPDDDTPMEKRCRDSQSSGEQRRVALEALIGDNQFTHGFYATHTFEVDLVITKENAESFVSCLSEIYERQVDIDAAKLKLENPDVAISGLEALRIAKKVGKGWYALLLADCISYKTSIPHYVLEAIAFASSHINFACRRKAAEYRLKQFALDEDSPNNEDAAEIDFDVLDDNLFVEAFVDLFPEDELSSLIASL